MRSEDSQHIDSKTAYGKPKIDLIQIFHDDVITTSPIVDGGDIGPWDQFIKMRNINIGNDAGIQGGAN